MLIFPRQRHWFTASRPRRTGRPRLVIEILECRELLTTWIVTDTSDSATDPHSLRYAIANAVDADTIHFNIPTSDPGYDAVTGSWTITPSSTLSVNTSIIIDGTSQPGFTRGGHPVIVLNGRNASASDGIDLNTDGCTVEGLVINGFDQGAGVSMVSSNSTIRANYIGTDVTGTVDMGNRDGIVATVTSTSSAQRGRIVPPPPTTET